eukprot:g6042.t1
MTSLVTERKEKEMKHNNNSFPSSPKKKKYYYPEVDLPKEIKGHQKLYYRQAAFKKLPGTEKIRLSLSLYSKRSLDTKKQMFNCLKNQDDKHAKGENSVQAKLNDLTKNFNTFDEFCKQFENMNFQPCVYKDSDGCCLDLPDMHIRYNDSLSSIQEMAEKKMTFSKYSEWLSNTARKTKEKKKMNREAQKANIEKRDSLPEATFPSGINLAHTQRLYYTSNKEYNGQTLHRWDDLINELDEERLCMSLHAMLRTDQRNLLEKISHVKDKKISDLAKVFNSDAYKYGGEDGFTIMYYTQEKSHPMCKPEYVGNHVVDFPDFVVIFTHDLKRIVTTFMKGHCTWKQFMERKEKRKQFMKQKKEREARKEQKKKEVLKEVKGRGGVKKLNHNRNNNRSHENKTTKGKKDNNVNRKKNTSNTKTRKSGKKNKGKDFKL